MENFICFAWNFKHLECHFMWWLKHFRWIYGVNFEFDSLLSNNKMTHSIICNDRYILIFRTYAHIYDVLIFTHSLTHSVPKFATNQIFHQYIAIAHGHTQEHFSTSLERYSSFLNIHNYETNEVSFNGTSSSIKRDFRKLCVLVTKMNNFTSFHPFYCE